MTNGTSLRTKTPALGIAYELTGREDGAPVILLHGWPDDVRTWDRMLSDLHTVGLCTCVPFLTETA
jgi:pimeloyl-ACP methyl ester carboxylesterase